MAKRASKSGRNRRAGRGRSPQMVFTRRNYVLLIVGVVLVVVGYVIMRIDNQVEGFISLYVAPLVILGGYLEIIYAVLWRSTESSGSDSRTQAASGAER